MSSVDECRVCVCVQAACVRAKALLGDFESHCCFMSTVPLARHSNRASRQTVDKTRPHLCFISIEKLYIGPSVFALRL